MDLNKLSLEELLELEADLKKIIEKKKTEEEKLLLETIKTTIKEKEINLKHVISGLTKRKEVSKKVYQNPNNENEVWSGKGRKPNWIKAYLQNHSNLNDLKIK